MNTLFRYLAREIYLASALVLIAFAGLFAFFDLINELEDIGKGEYQLLDAAIYVVLLLPGRIYELLPVAVLIGALYALTTLARHSEITVMRAAGLSTAALMRMLAFIGSALVLLTFVVGEYLAPPAEAAAQEWRLNATQANISQQLRSGLWVKDGDLVINVRMMLPDRSMAHTRVYEFGPDHGLRSISEAERGVHDGEDHWRLLDVARTRFTAEGTVVDRLAEIEWRSELTPEVLGVLMVGPEHMPLAKLWTYVRHLQDNKQRADRYEIALWKKIIYPFAVLVMLALALPFAFLHDRMGGAGARIFTGIMLGVGFHLLNGLLSNLGVINAWPPLLAALTPSLLFLLAAGGILYLVERR